MPNPGVRNSPTNTPPKRGKFESLPPTPLGGAPEPAPPQGGMFVPGEPLPYLAPVPPEPLKPNRSVGRKEAKDQGYAPAVYLQSKQGQGQPEEDTDPLLKELKYASRWPCTTAAAFARC